MCCLIDYVIAQWLNFSQRISELAFDKEASSSEQSLIFFFTDGSRFLRALLGGPLTVIAIRA